LLVFAYFVASAPHPNPCLFDTVGAFDGTSLKISGALANLAGVWCLCSLNSKSSRKGLVFPLRNLIITGAAPIRTVEFSAAPPVLTLKLVLDKLAILES
jgi:hypothetical protein